jgi:hypothetical protein
MTSMNSSLATKTMQQANTAWSHAFGRVNSIPGSPGSNEGSGYA